MSEREHDAAVDGNSVHSSALPSIDSYLTIGRMRLVLPPGYAGRADVIARQIAQHLSSWPLAHSGQVPRLSVSPITVRAGETDTALALRIAQAIHGQAGRSLERRTDNVLPNPASRPRGHES